MDFDALDEVVAPAPKPSKTEPSEGSDGFDLKSTAPITKTDESRRKRRDLTEKLVVEDKAEEEEQILPQGTDEQFPDAEGVSKVDTSLIAVNNEHGRCATVSYEKVSVQFMQRRLRKKNRNKQVGEKPKSRRKGNKKILKVSSYTQSSSSEGTVKFLYSASVGRSGGG